MGRGYIDRFEASQSVFQEVWEFGAGEGGRVRAKDSIPVGGLRVRNDGESKVVTQHKKRAEQQGRVLLTKGSSLSRGQVQDEFGSAVSAQDPAGGRGPVGLGPSDD